MIKIIIVNTNPEGLPGFGEHIALSPAPKRHCDQSYKTFIA
jgi:hypothetical protein